MSKVQWIKISTDIIHNRKIEALRYEKQGNHIILLWFYMLVLAGQTNDKGLIYFTKTIPYTSDKLQREFNIPKSIIEQGINYFKTNDMIKVDDKGIIEIIGWIEYQNAEMLERIRQSNRVRQQRHYQYQKAIESAIEEQPNYTPNTYPNAQPNTQPNDNLLDDIALDNGYSNRVDKNRIEENRVEKKRIEEDSLINNKPNTFAIELINNKILSESDAIKLNPLLKKVYEGRETSLLTLISILKNQNTNHTVDSVERWIKSLNEKRL